MVPSSPYGPWSMITTTSRPWRSSSGRLPAGSVRTRPATAALSVDSARLASAFFTAPSASLDGSATRASAASARRGSPPTTQRPLRAMPIGTTAWPRSSSAAMTDAADASDTSCSPERPPKTTPTRRRGIRSILAGAGARPGRSSAGLRLLRRDENGLGDQTHELVHPPRPQVAQEPHGDGDPEVGRAEKDPLRQVAKRNDHPQEARPDRARERDHPGKGGQRQRRQQHEHERGDDRLASTDGG